MERRKLLQKNNQSPKDELSRMEHPDPFENFAEGNGTLIDIPELCRVGQELGYFSSCNLERHLTICDKCKAAIAAENGCNAIIRDGSRPSQSILAL